MNFTAQIGETAGLVWQALDRGGEQKFSTLKKQVKAPDPLLYLALGWLAREDKIQVEAEGRSYRVKLK